MLIYLHFFNSYHSLDNDGTEVWFETSSFSVDFYRKNLRTGGIIIAFFFTPNLGATPKHLRMSYQLAKQLWKIFSWSIWTYTLWVDTLVSLYEANALIYTGSGTVTVDKTSHKNEHLSNGDYFAIIAFCSHSILLTNYAKNEPVRAP